MRDESASAVSVSLVEDWSRMMRAAARLTGAARILYVSHQTEARALADSRIEL